MQEPLRHEEPSDDELLQRLERDVAWLESRGLWTRALFERAVARYLNARRSAEGLDDFARRHGAEEWMTERSTE
jgi:hypothetical protein